MVTILYAATNRETDKPNRYPHLLKADGMEGQVSHAMVQTACPHLPSFGKAVYRRETIWVILSLNIQLSRRAWGRFEPKDENVLKTTVLLAGRGHGHSSRPPNRASLPRAETQGRWPWCCRLMWKRWVRAVATSMGFGDVASYLPCGCTFEHGD